MLDQYISTDCRPKHIALIDYQIKIDHYINPTVPIVHMIWYFYEKSLDCNQELAADHREMIVRCSLSSLLLQQKLKKLYLVISQAQSKDRNWQKTICFRRNSSFFWIWWTQSSLVQMTNNKDTPKQTIHKIVSKTGEVLHSIVTLTHSLSSFNDIVASPPKGQSSYAKEKISAQTHTIVKQSSKPKGNFLFPSLFSLSKNCMHD